MSSCGSSGLFISSSTPSTIKSYQYNGWQLTYRYKPASPGYENQPPLLLIHPVGIGLASWFWEPFMAAWEQEQGPAICAPNLIGCGISEGGDAWNPDERGLFIPLDWARGCEALMQHIDENNGEGGKHLNPNDIFQDQKLFMGNFFNGLTTIVGGNRSWMVVTQGGLAPVGILLAARNPNLVNKLVMVSPPTWKDLTTAVPEDELDRNYNFLRSPIWGVLAFRLLETRRAVEFFSSQFLFANECDTNWLEKIEEEFGIEARPPVQVFNAGFCMNRSLEAELVSIDQPTLIVHGKEDKRQRREYVQNMKNCAFEVLPGKNVIPWEYPTELADLLSRR